MNYAIDRNNQDIIGLPDLLKTGPVEPGFYALSGSRSMVPTVMSGLVDFLSMESTTSYSDPALTNRNRGGRSEIGQLIWVDSGNYFDPYHISKLSVRRGLNPRRILRSIQVARPFTAFQFEQMLDKIPKPSMFKVSPANAPFSKKGSISESRDVHIQRTPLIIISDLMSLFYDSEIQERDVQRAFQEFSMRLSFLKKRAIILGLHVRYPAPSGRTQFLPQILSQADRILMPKQYLNEQLAARSSQLVSRHELFLKEPTASC